MSPESQKGLWPRLRGYFAVFLGFTYVVAGIPHFTHPDFYLPMMPPYLPWHLELIYLSGLFEILGGIGLALPKTRKVAGWGLVALLFAVFPANIHIVAAEVQLTADPINPVVMWLRLPLQLVFIASVWWAAELRLKPGSSDNPPASSSPNA